MLHASREHKRYSIDFRKNQLDEPLEHVGEFEVPVKLHKDVIVQVKVVINKEADADALA